MGKGLKGKFLEAGFADPRSSASFDFFDTPKDVAFFYGIATGWFLSPQVIGAAIKFGLATQDQFDQWRADLAEWKTNPAASGAVAFGECLAFKP